MNKEIIFFIIKVNKSYKMKMMFRAFMCLVAVMATLAPSARTMGTENTYSHLENLNEWDQEDAELAHGLEDDIGHAEAEEKSIAELARLVSEEMKRNARTEARFDAKRQDGKAGLWGKRTIQPVPAHQGEESDDEILRRAVMKMDLLNARVLNERASKREQHGSTGLWGKRSKNEHAIQEETSLNKRMVGKKQPDKTGLWGRRRSAEKQLYRLSKYPKKQNGQSNQPPTIGLWGGKRAAKDRNPTRGPSESEKLGLWGKRQQGKAGLWGRRRSLVKIF